VVCPDGSLNVTFASVGRRRRKVHPPATGCGCLGSSADVTTRRLGVNRELSK